MWCRQPWLIPPSLKLSLIFPDDHLRRPRMRTGEKSITQAGRRPRMFVWMSIKWALLLWCFGLGGGGNVLMLVCFSLVTHFAARMQKTARHKSAELDFSPDIRPWWRRREKSYEIIVQQRSKHQIRLSFTFKTIHFFYISSFILAIKVKKSKQPTEERIQKKKKKMWGVTRLVCGYFGSEQTPRASRISVYDMQVLNNWCARAHTQEVCAETLTQAQKTQLEPSHICSKTVQLAQPLYKCSI